MSEASTEMRRTWSALWLRALGLALMLPFPVAARPGWDLSQEDLERALARGDIDADDYERLLDLFRLREVESDSAVDTLPGSGELDPGDLDSLLGSSATALPGVRGASFEVYQRLRGTAARREWLMLAPSAGAVRMHVELSRAGPNEWRVLRRHVSWQSSQMSMVAGSFDARWIDGLVIDAAPAFLNKREHANETVLFPDRGRLNGLLCDWSVQGAHVAAIASRTDDGELAHSVLGLSVAREFSGVRIETAYMHQTMRGSGSPGFAGGIWGWAAERRSRGLVATGAVAVGADDWAAQGKLDLAQAESHRLGVAAWRVGPRFRNPLLDGAAQSDREPVYYPELDRSISNAATGERGGELRLQAGRPGRRFDGALRYWREQPQRGASVRAVTGYELGRHQWKWRGEYRFYRRVDGTGTPQRHEWRLRVSRSRGYGDVRLRRTFGSWSPFGALGGKVEAGVRFGRGGERQSLVLAWTDYDFALRHSAYVTVRSSQSLRFSRTVRLLISAQWRAAYHAHPPEVSLRVTTRSSW